MPDQTTDNRLEQNTAPVQPRLPRWTRRFVHAVLLALVLVTWGWLTWSDVIPALQANTWPYSAYWIGPRLALEGRADLIYTDSSVYMREIARLNVTADLLEVNVPATYLAFLPLALLPISDAFHVWTVLSLATFAIGWLVLLRALRLPLSLALLLTAAVPLFEPFSQNIKGQAYLVLFSLVTLSAVVSVHARTLSSDTMNARRSRQVLGGALLGVVALFKVYYGLALALPAIVQRRWAFLAATCLTLGLAVLVTIAAWGAGIWERAIYLSLAWRERPETVHTAYQTTHSLITHLFRYDAQWNPAPVADLPWLPNILWWTVTLIIVSTTALVLWRSGKRLKATSMQWQLLPLSMIIPVATALAPVSESYHFALCLFPIVVVVAILYHRWRQLWAIERQGRGLPWNLLGMTVGLLAAVILLGAPWKYNVMRVDGWSSLMHYPRLYGALLLWLLIVVLLARPAIAGSAQKADAMTTSEPVP